MVDKDTGVVIALINRFETQRLPRARRLKKKVDRGERLDEGDLSFLKSVEEDAKYVRTLVYKHPEWQPFVTQVTALYQEITDKALANEQSSGPRMH